MGVACGIAESGGQSYETHHPAIPSRVAASDQGLTIFFRPPQHTPAGCTRGDLQILRNLHLHEHFQRADIKAGCRDVLESHGV